MFHRLSDLRRKLATAEKVPPYLIFHDKTLWGMVESLPEDLPSLGKISGVGKAKLEKYGGVFLDALRGVAV
jgi:ATP-dependent DNA helicase RecQ